MRVLSIDKKACIHYVLIYLVLVAVGSVKFSEYHNLFILLDLGLMVYTLIKQRNITKFDSSNIHLLIVLLLGLFEIVVTDGSFTLTNALYILSCFAIGYAAVMYDPEKVYERYVKIVVFLTSISLVAYALVLLGLDSVLKLLPLNSTTYMQCVSHGGWLYHYMEGYERNPSIFTEPGLFQMILLTALFILLFRSNALSEEMEKKKVRYFVILLLGLLSAQSTTGYIGLVFLMACYFISRNNKQDSSIRKWVILIALVVAIGLAANYAINGSDSIIYKDFIYKLFDENMNVSVSASTGDARVQCMLADLAMVIQRPWGWGYIDYQNNWLSYLAYEIFSYNSSVGLTKMLAVLGVVFTGYILWYFVRGFIKTSKQPMEALAIILIYFNTALAQPSLYFPCFMILTFMCAREKKETVEERNIMLGASYD